MVIPPPTPPPPRHGLSESQRKHRQHQKGQIRPIRGECRGEVSSPTYAPMGLSPGMGGMGDERHSLSRIYDFTLVSTKKG